jgi:hypothetical protein
VSTARCTGIVLERPAQASDDGSSTQQREELDERLELCGGQMPE